jgi:hypothetical protein
MAEMRDSTIKITQACLAEIEALPEYGNDELVNSDGNLWFFDLNGDDEVYFSDALLAILHKYQVNGYIHVYQGISNYGRSDDEEYGYEFEDGIMYQLETVVTWRRVAPQQ